MHFDKKNLIPVLCGGVAVLAALFYGYDAYTRYRIAQVDSFIYKGKIVKLVESSYNCGFLWQRMTERCLEVAIAKIWLDRNKENVVEIGAVTPYYFGNFTHDVCDPADKHKKVNLKTSMFNVNLRGKNVLSISTIEHIGTGEYGVPIDKEETAMLALDKILNESKRCLITFPIGANKELEQYVLRKDFLNFHKNVKITFFVREPENNYFTETTNVDQVKRTKYGPVGANAVVIIEK